MTLMIGVPVSATGADLICFTQAHNDRLKFQVIQQAPPPLPGEPAYAFYPLTGVTTMQLGALARSEKRYDRYYFQWTNRSNAPLYSPAGRLLPRKANIQPSSLGLRRQRTPFSTVPRADSCTLAQTASVLGLSARARVFARNGGVSLVSETRQADHDGAGPQDVCVVAAGRLPADGTGIVLDYEAQDGRTAQQTIDFLSRFTGLVHDAGRKAVLLVDPLDAPSQRYSGISAENANRIVRMFDLTTIFLWSRNRQGDMAASYAAQKAMIAAGGPFDPRRLIIDFDLAGTTIEDARWVRRTILNDGLAGVMIWRNRAIQGGACSTPENRKLGALLLGE